ncbi:hypothetical protein PACILC2_45160 [Paenibacillus cisolokensis]|uniref:Cobalt transporter n=1 Tax=Paenibacillus cisolokensis TaxID=1658519 RepID=A0ABQ4NCK0_9BACL|nr:hypothetical protein [Paenibacillus cisolokensis]GIQ65948.1 hypothetical protein PACILC2_45160 [Paenibacillus cisolokensis]
MHVSIRRLAAVMLLAATCLYVLSASGWEAVASGHEHLHGETSGEWANLFG